MTQADISQIEQFHQNQQNIVLATGVFDILHQEHQKFLEKAKQAGDVLVIGIESDVRVRQIKGLGRPIHSQSKRRQHLTQLNLADYIFILPQQFDKPSDHEQLIALIKPKVLAVSSHTKHLKAKEQILSKYGGCVKIVHQQNPKISTTKLIEMNQ